jgi:hypothetical protein
MNAPILPREFPLRPGRLWSLWEMLEPVASKGFLIARFAAAERVRLEAAIASQGAEAKANYPSDLINLSGVESADVSATMEALPMAFAQITRVVSLLKVGTTLGELLYAYRALEERLEDELKSLMYFHVPSTFARYYMDAQPFGESVNTRFASAIDDIEEAGKCLALQRGTAAVMHLMRVMEAGLKALAAPLGIPYAPSWESYLKQIADKIGQPWKKKSRKWRKEEPFFRDLSGDLMTVKQAWRNPSMHIVRKYSPEEAEEIFRAVRNFMQRLASGLPA